jgi:hypothetical protein
MGERENISENEATSRRDLLKIGGFTALGSAVASALVSSGAASASLKSSAVAPHVTVAQKQNRFSVQINGKVVPGISAVDIETDASVLSDPASPPINTVTISRDWSNTPEFFNWRKAVLDGKVDRRSISVIFQNDAGQETYRANFFQCWPCKWVGPSLNARSSAHAQEKLEISWETMELKA